MNELEKLTDKLEYIFLHKIINWLLNQAVTIPDAKNYAIQFLKLEPFTSVEDAKIKIHNFTSEYTNFPELAEYINAYETEKKTQAVIEKMRTHLQKNNIDQALEVVKDLKNAPSH